MTQVPSDPRTRRGWPPFGAAASRPRDRPRGAVRPQRAGGDTTTWKVQTSWPAGVGLADLQGVVRHHQGEDRRRARVQAVRGQGDRRRLRTARRRQERRARGDELVHALLGGQGAGDGVPVVLPDGPALSARVGRVLLQQGRHRGGARDVRQAGPDSMSTASITGRTSSIRRSRSARSRTSRTSSCACRAA